MEQNHLGHRNPFQEDNIRRYPRPLPEADSKSTGLVAGSQGERPQVSKHLRVLREVGAVDVRDEGRRRMYRLNANALKPIHDWVGDFYSGLFGWEIEPIEDDGTLVYTTIKNAGNQNGGFMPMNEQHGDAPSFWLPYFTVPSRDDAIEQARELGGMVLAGPLDLPAGKIAILADPQGAAFTVFEGETDE
jgi:predicted enzyme related to lactoylglutathione lyase